MVSTEYSNAVNGLRVELIGTAPSGKALLEPHLFKVYLTPSEIKDAPIEHTKVEPSGSRKRKAKMAPARKRAKLSLPDGPDAIRQLIQSIATEQAAEKGIDLDPEVLAALLNAGEDLVDERLRNAPEVDEDEAGNAVSVVLEEAQDDVDDSDDKDQKIAPSNSEDTPSDTSSSTFTPNAPTTTPNSEVPLSTTTTSSTSTTTTTSPAPAVPQTTTTILSETSIPATAFLSSTKSCSGPSLVIVHLWKDGYSLNDGEIRKDISFIKALSEGYVFKVVLCRTTVQLSIATTRAKWVTNYVDRKSVPELQGATAKPDEQVLVLIEDHGESEREEAINGKVSCGWCNATLSRAEYDEHEQKCAILTNKRGILVANEKARAAKKNLEGQECKQQ